MSPKPCKIQSGGNHKPQEKPLPLALWVKREGSQVLMSEDESIALILSRRVSGQSIPY